MKTAFQVIGVILAVVLLSVALMMWATGMEIFGLRLGKHVENARTGVTRETNQYVTTQQQTLATYAKEYQRAKEDGSTAQMKLIAEQMDQVAQTLSGEYISQSVAAILVGEGYNDPKYQEAMYR